MKKTLLAVGIAAAMGAGATQAAFFAADSTYTVIVHDTSCFAFGDCTAGGAAPASGSFTLTTDGTGTSYSVGSYTMIPYTPTAGGVFTTGGTVNGTGTVGDSGELDLNFDGRTGSAQFFPTLGPAWNIDDGVASGTGVYEGFTTGTDSNVDPTTGALNVTLTGSHLTLTSTSNGIGWWEGTLVSVGNVGSQWDFFSGTPYTEVYDIWIHGALPGDEPEPPEPPTPPIPVPAAVWLFGSGLVGLAGVARRRRKSA